MKASYLFLAPLQLLAKDGSRLRYAASFAMRGALKSMGTLAAEMCAPYCLSLVVTPLSDLESEWAYTLLKEFIKSLNPKAVKTVIFPTIQKILQASYDIFIFIYLLLMYGSFLVNFILIETFISDARLFTLEGFSFTRLLCTRDMESRW